MSDPSVVTIRAFRPSDQNVARQLILKGSASTSASSTTPGSWIEVLALYDAAGFTRVDETRGATVYRLDLGSAIDR